MKILSYGAFILSIIGLILFFLNVGDINISVYSVIAIFLLLSTGAIMSLFALRKVNKKIRKYYFASSDENIILLRKLKNLNIVIILVNIIIFIFLSYGMIRLNSFGIGGPAIISEDYSKTDTINLKNIIDKKQIDIDTLCYNIYLNMNEQDFLQEIDSMKIKNIIYDINNEKTNLCSIYNGKFLYLLNDKSYPASFNINFKNNKLFYFQINITNDSIKIQNIFDDINDYFNNKYGTYNYFNNENNYQQYWWFHNSKYIFNLKISKHIIIEFRSLDNI